VFGRLFHGARAVALVIAIATLLSPRVVRFVLVVRGKVCLIDPKHSQGCVWVDGDALRYRRITDPISRSQERPWGAGGRCASSATGTRRSVT
jgi:hypothetical protein